MSKDRKPSIVPAPNGPYIVKALKILSNKNGLMETTETMALCRCGGSSNKPFCDGTHAKNGFSSTRLDGRLEDKKASYKGEKITIYDNRSICAHAGFCTDSLASVFRMKQEPWINPDAGTIEDIIAAVRKCPSGALSYTIDAAENGGTENEPAVTVAPNGPYIVSGGIDLSDTTWGEGASTNKYTLCRCGGSKNKPFCDGSHWRIKFSDGKN